MNEAPSRLSGENISYVGCNWFIISMTHGCFHSMIAWSSLIWRCKILTASGSNSHQCIHLLTYNGEEYMHQLDSIFGQFNVEGDARNHRQPFIQFLRFGGKGLQITFADTTKRSICTGSSTVSAVVVWGIATLISCSEIFRSRHALKVNVSCSSVERPGAGLRTNSILQGFLVALSRASRVGRYGGNALKAVSKQAPHCGSWSSHLSFRLRQSSQAVPCRCLGGVGSSVETVIAVVDIVLRSLDFAYQRDQWR